MKELIFFKEYLNKFNPVSDKDWALFSDVCKIERYSKNQVIHDSGKVFKSVKFLCTGLVRSHLIDSEGKDFTWSIHYNNNNSQMKNLFVVDYASLLEQKPSDLIFESLEPTVLVSLKKTDLDRLHDQSIYWSNVARAISGMAYCATHHRTISLLTKSAKQRYNRLLLDDPSFINTVPQYYVASYLGITPQSLSRLKKEIEAG